MKLQIKESDDKITAKNFQELIDKLEAHGYSCGHYYDVDYPDSNWLYITKDGNSYEAEFYKYRDGEYELYLHNIHPTKGKSYNESVNSYSIPYDLVSELVILKDYIDIDDAYINNEHKILVDIADFLYNSGLGVDYLKPKSKLVYDKYGKDYFDNVLDDVQALDTQVDSRNV